jgi:hypothetical protein
MKSKKLLFVALDKFFKTDKYTKNKLKAVRNETYGKKSCIYIDTETPVVRKQLERFLVQEGFKVCFDYWPGSSTAEVQVSYFRGERWYE